MDQSLKYESYNYKSVKSLDENIEVNCHDLGNGFLDMIPKAQTSKEKNR